MSPSIYQSTDLIYRVSITLLITPTLLWRGKILFIVSLCEKNSHSQSFIVDIGVFYAYGMIQ